MLDLGGKSTVLTPGGTIRPANRGSLGTNHNLARTPYQSSVGFLTLQDLLDFPTNPDTYKHNLRARILVGQEDLLDIHGRWDEFGGVVRPVSPINSVAALGPAFDRDPNRLDITKEQIDQGLERLSATWLDLLLWSVLMGEMGLAWEFWRKCSEPLRAAILAARTCRTRRATTRRCCRIRRSRSCSRMRTRSRVGVRAARSDQEGGRGDETDLPRAAREDAHAPVRGQRPPRV